MAHTTFPFANFLEILRSRGVPTGLSDYARVAKLLSRWKGCDIRELGIAIAALLGRSQQECEQIRELFLESYAQEGQQNAAPMMHALPAPHLDKAVSEISSSLVGARRSRSGMPTLVLFLSIALLGLLLGQAMIIGLPSRLQHHPKERPDRGEALPSPIPKPREVGVSQLRKSVFSRKRPLAHAPVGLAFFGAAIGGLLLLSFARRQRARHERALAQPAIQPGPTQYTLSAEHLHSPLHESTVVKLTTILGCEHTRQAELNLAATLEASLQSAAFMQLVYHRSTPPGELLLLIDESAEMAPWKYKVAMIIDALRRRGIALKAWSFDAEPFVVRSRTSGQMVSLARLASETAQQPLWIISIGGGICTPAATLRPWVEITRRWRASAFLTPITLQSLWPESLAKLPMRSYPLNEDGLLSAAHAVMARAPALPPMRREPSAAPVITGRDCTLLRRLLCLVPDPDVYYAFALRLRFLPAAPEEIVLYLLAEQPHVGGVRLEQSLDEQAQLQQALHAESPQLEREARGFLLQLLHNAEPRPGTLAHMRWRLAHAQQQLWLASTAQASVPFIREIEQMRSRSQGPLGVEVEAALGRARRRERLISRRESALAAQSAPGLRRQWSGLRLRDVAYASAIVVVFTILFIFGRRIVDREFRITDSFDQGIQADAGIAVYPPLVDFGSAESVITTSDRDGGRSSGDLAGLQTKISSKYYPKYPHDSIYNVAEGSQMRFGRIIRRHGPKPYFYIVGMTEVSQGQFKKIMKYNPSKFIGPDLPVESVTWFDAVKFANALSTAENLKPCYILDKEQVEWPEGTPCRGYRLPTRGEWWTAECRSDKALRGASSIMPLRDICEPDNGLNFPYEDSGSIDPWFRHYELYDKINDNDRIFENIAWYRVNSADKTHPVGLKRHNTRNLYDMLGNVEEWLWDYEYSDTPSAQHNRRLIIGGSFFSHAKELIWLRTSAMAPKTALPSIGFRVVRTIEAPAD